MEPKCKDCKFFDDMIMSVGLCRHDTPMMAYSDDDPFNAVWPEVNNYDWCGEFQEKETCPKAA